MVGGLTIRFGAITAGRDVKPSLLFVKPLANVLSRNQTGSIALWEWWEASGFIRAGTTMSLIGSLIERLNRWFARYRVGPHWTMPTPESGATQHVK
jgi:hypothetical protein